MGMFNGVEEQARKRNLEKLEDKRVAFAAKLAEEGFRPERMLFTQTTTGGYLALCRFQGQYCLIIAPTFGTDEAFQMERFDELDWRAEEVYVKAEGMGGIFGFGKKAEMGVEYVITRHDGSEARMSFVGGRGSWLECALKKNPLLDPRRRRGNANVAWDMKPLDNTAVAAALKVAEGYFPKKQK